MTPSCTLHLQDIFVIKRDVQNFDRIICPSHPLSLLTTQLNTILVSMDYFQLPHVSKNRGLTFLFFHFHKVHLHHHIWQDFLLLWPQSNHVYTYMCIRCGHALVISNVVMKMGMQAIFPDSGLISFGREEELLQDTILQYSMIRGISMLLSIVAEPVDNSRT